MQIKYWRKKTLGQRTKMCSCLCPTHSTTWARPVSGIAGRGQFALQRGSQLDFCIVTYFLNPNFYSSFNITARWKDKENL